MSDDPLFPRYRQGAKRPDVYWRPELKLTAQLEQRLSEVRKKLAGGDPIRDDLIRRIEEEAIQEFKRIQRRCDDGWGW